MHKLSIWLLACQSAEHASSRLQNAVGLSCSLGLLAAFFLNAFSIMDSESSDESQEEVDIAGDVEQDAEEDNIDDQVNSQSMDGDEDQEKPAKPSVTSNPTNTRTQPTVRPEALKAAVYDIVPTMYGIFHNMALENRKLATLILFYPPITDNEIFDSAAPHSTSINAVTSTPDLRWVFSGGSDGYIRKFNWIETANGKSMLTVAQRHPFVDSVVKAGVLASYWENSDGSSGKPALNVISCSLD